MSESAGKMRHGAEKTAKAVGATAAGAAEGRRVQSIREPLSPGAYVEYSVDDQPGVVERARAFLAGAPGEPVAPRMAATVMLVSEGKPHYRRFESPLAGGAPIEETVDAAPVDVFMLRRASTMAFTPDAVVFPGGGMDVRDVECAVPWAGPSSEQWACLMSCPVSVAKASLRRRPGRSSRRAACFWPLLPTEARPSTSSKTIGLPNVKPWPRGASPSGNSFASGGSCCAVI